MRSKVVIGILLLSALILPATSMAERSAAKRSQRNKTRAKVQIACITSDGQFKIRASRNCRSDETLFDVSSLLALTGASENGEEGLAGPQGEQGIRGVQGPIGPQGPRGQAGEAGPQGPVGAQGPRGFTGDTGAPGADGLDGAQGPRGLQGLQGPVGPRGAVGISGYQFDVRELPMAASINTRLYTYSCPQNKKILSVGYQIKSDDSRYANKIIVTRSEPDMDAPQGNAWRFSFSPQEDFPDNVSWGVNLYGVCANIDG